MNRLRKSVVVDFAIMLMSCLSIVNLMATPIILRRGSLLDVCFLLGTVLLVALDLQVVLSFTRVWRSLSFSCCKAF